VVEAPIATEVSTGAAPSPLTEDLARVAEPLVLASAPPAPAGIHGTIQVLDDSGSPVAGAQVRLTIVPHESDRACASRPLTGNSPDGTIQVEFSQGEALSGFALSEEQQAEHLQALAAGSRMVPAGPTPVDPDTCSLALAAEAKGYRKVESSFDFSIRAAAESEEGFRCEIRLPPSLPVPLLHLTVIDAVTGAPVSGAVVKYSGTRSTNNGAYALTDASGKAQEILGVRREYSGELMPDCDPAVLPRSEGIPLPLNAGGANRVSVERYPDYAPGYFWFEADAAFLARSDLYETVALTRREYLSLQLLDSRTHAPIEGEGWNAKIFFLARFPVETFKGHPWLEQGTAQSYTVNGSPIRVGIDAQTFDGMIVSVKRPGGPGYRADYYGPHLVTFEEVRGASEELTVSLNRLRPFYLFLHDLDQPGRPVITDTSMIIEGMRTSRVLLDQRSEKFRMDEIPRRQKMALQTPWLELGSVEIYSGWEETLPDLQSLTLERLSITGSRSLGYELLGPDLRVLAPWSDADGRGVFTQPLALVADGLPVIGDEQGRVDLYVRCKRP